MRIGILATEDRKSSWLKMAGDQFSCTWVQDTQSAKNFDVFVDLNFDFFQDRLTQYAGNTDTVFLLSAVNAAPEKVFQNLGLKYSGEKIFGINAIPTFLERQTLEATNPFHLDTSLLENLNLPVKAEWVKSRVGMITPRIVFMIINEAYYTVQEGTAEKADIDIAMKLGTNYPKGPFEWCEEVGIDNVYTTLKAVFNDTGDERYKICPLLQTEWTHYQIR